MRIALMIYPKQAWLNGARGELNRPAAPLLTADVELLTDAYNDGVTQAAVLLGV